MGTPVTRWTQVSSRTTWAAPAKAAFLAGDRRPARPHRRSTSSPHSEGCAARRGGDAHGRPRESAPFDSDALGAIARRGRPLGDHHRDDLAHEAHAVGRHHGVRRHEANVFCAPDDLLVWVSGHRAVGDGFTPSAAASLPVNTAITLGLPARRGLDASDRRGRGGAHEIRIRLTRQVDVVAVAAAAGDQAGIFLAQDRLAEAFAAQPLRD